MNAFKDKLIDALPGAVRDLELLGAHAAFSPERFVGITRAAGAVSLVWIVANWLASERRSAPWARVRDRLGRAAPRPRYAAAFDAAIHARRPPGALLRVLARVGADRPSAQARALASMALKPLDGVFRACLGASNSRRWPGNEP